MRFFNRKKPKLIDLVQEIKILKLEPGDIVVLKYPGVLKKEIAERIMAHVNEIINEIIKEKNRTMILEDGMDLDVLRKKNGK